MSLFDFFRKTNDSGSFHKEEAPTKPISETTPAPPVTKPKTEKVYTIAYGTGMPIDVIYAFLNEDYEQAGYEDALVNSNAEYCKTKEIILIHKLQQLFSRILLRYQGDLVELDNKIDNAKALFALHSAAKLEARKEICQKHIAEINDMKQKLRNESPEMMIMIESYRRGFAKGFAAKNANFINSNQISDEQL